MAFNSALQNFDPHTCTARHLRVMRRQVAVHLSTIRALTVDLEAEAGALLPQVVTWSELLDVVKEAERNMLSADASLSSAWEQRFGT